MELLDLMQINPSLELAPVSGTVVVRDKLGRTECSRCPKKFVDGNKLVEHEQLIHDQKMEVRCCPVDDCLYWDQTLPAIERHCLSEHGSVDAFWEQMKDCRIMIPNVRYCRPIIRAALPFLSIPYFHPPPPFQPVSNELHRSHPVQAVYPCGWRGRYDNFDAVQRARYVACLYGADVDMRNPDSAGGGSSSHDDSRPIGSWDEDAAECVLSKRPRTSLVESSSIECGSDSTTENIRCFGRSSPSDESAFINQPCSSAKNTANFKPYKTLFDVTVNSTLNDSKVAEEWRRFAGVPELRSLQMRGSPLRDLVDMEIEPHNSPMIVKKEKVDVPLSLPSSEEIELAIAQVSKMGVPEAVIKSLEVSSSTQDPNASNLNVADMSISMNLSNMSDIFKTPMAPKSSVYIKNEPEEDVRPRKQFSTRDRLKAAHVMIPIVGRIYKAHEYHLNPLRKKRKTVVVPLLPVSGSLPAVDPRLCLPVFADAMKLQADRKPLHDECPVQTRTTHAAIVSARQAAKQPSKKICIVASDVIPEFEPETETDPQITESLGGESPEEPVDMFNLALDSAFPGSSISFSGSKKTETSQSRF